MIAQAWPSKRGEDTFTRYRVRPRMSTTSPANISDDGDALDGKTAVSEDDEELAKAYAMTMSCPRRKTALCEDGNEDNAILSHNRSVFVYRPRRRLRLVKL